jgi:uncharacterized protein (TIGR03067 family)
MIRRLAFAVLISALAALGARAGEPEDAAAAEMKKFEGNWKLVRKEYKGGLWPTGYRKEGIYIEDGKISWTANGSDRGQQTADMSLDPTTNPKSIDIEITRGSMIGKKLLGIYEIKGKKLTICWSEPDGEKRPKKFTTKTTLGAGESIEVYQSMEDGNASADSGKDTASSKNSRRDRGASQIESKAEGNASSAAELKILEGNWKLVRKEYKGRLWPPYHRKEGIFFEDGKISWTADGSARGQQTADMSLDPTTSPKSIDIEFTRGSMIGKKLLGIYEIKGKKLTICWSEPDGEKRPKKFMTKTTLGAGESLEVYQKEKD